MQLGYTAALIVRSVWMGEQIQPSLVQ